jgi:hypothetical protein
MLSHDRWLWFFFGRLRVPTRRCDLVVPADWGWGRSNKNKKNHHFIRIGVINQYSPRKVEMQQNMYGVMIIRIKQQQFRQSTEQLVWNTIIEKEKDDTDDDTEGDSSDSDNDDSVKDVPVVTPKKKINDAKTDMASSYPFKSKALGVEDGGCFDPTDPSVQKSMRCLLRELNALLSTTYELNTTDMSNNKIC